jgi:hypothetical protein
VVVVEEDCEQPHVVTCRFHLFVVVRADLAWRVLDGVAASAVEFDQFEGFDFLRLAVFRHVEVGLREVRDRVAGLVRDDHVDPDEVDAGAEDRRLRGIGWRRRLWRRLLRRRLLLGAALQAKRDCQSGGGEYDAHPTGHGPILDAFECSVRRCPGRPEC